VFQKKSNSIAKINFKFKNQFQVQKSNWRIFFRKTYLRNLKKSVLVTQSFSKFYTKIHKEIIKKSVEIRQICVICVPKKNQFQVQKSISSSKINFKFKNQNEEIFFEKRI